MAASEPAGRRDRKKSETRRALRTAALRLAQEVGYENLTIEAITEAVDVSARTFFNYFGSKDDALLALDPEWAAELADSLSRRPAEENPVQALRAVFVALADELIEGEPVWWARMELVRATPELWPQLVARFAQFERRLTEAVAARIGSDPDADLYPGVVAASVVGALRVAVEHRRSGRNAVPLSGLLDAAFDTLAAGLAPPAAPVRRPAGTGTARVRSGQRAGASRGAGR